MNTVTLSMAFLMGFTLSLHCAGMCGPILLVMPFQAFQGLRKAAAVFIYHAGRASVYAAMAVVLHSFRSLFQPRVQQYVSIGMGTLLLVLGVLTFLPGAGVQIKMPWSGVLKKQLGRFMGNPGLGAIAGAGVLNGLLPCGLVYVALSASLSAGSAGQAALFMYVFAAGTMPMLLGITLLSKSGLFASKIGFLRGPSLKRLVPVIMFVFGCLFIVRGMNLGIPYLSPKVEVTGHAIKSCCCHKMK